MGLDMYAYKAKGFVPENDISFDIPEGIEAEEIAYWRKHPNLHGWMENLYASRGGSEVFNCISIQLKMEDIERLEKDILTNSLPDTEGFFFGKSRYWHAVEDMQFIGKAKLALADGYIVYYSSWW